MNPVVYAKLLFCLMADKQQVVKQIPGSHSLSAVALASLAYLVSYNCFSDFLLVTERHGDMCRTEELFHWASVSRQLAFCQWLH